MAGTGNASDAALREIVAGLRERLLMEAETATPGIPEVVRPRAPEHPTRAQEMPSSPVAEAVPAIESMAERVDEPTEQRGDHGADKRVALQQLAVEAESCTACVLHEQRHRSVFARGNPDAELVFIGEGPGRDEDLQGKPFVGAAGQLLDRMITAMGFAQDEVYICNVVKCRPPENRTPSQAEAAACARFLNPQIDAVAPKVIVGLGRCAAESLGLAQERGAFRGRWGSFRGVATFATYHPAYLLRTPEAKKVVWADLQMVMERFGRKPPQRERR